MRAARAALLLAALATLLLPSTATAQTVVRVATFNASLSRQGAGLMLQHIERDGAQALSVAGILRHIRPDIVLINEFDHDPEERALAAFVALLAREDGPGGAPIRYPHTFSAGGNSGVPTGRDLDGDGAAFGPRDAQGYGRHPGHYAMALLSRYPIEREAVRRFGHLLWADVPDTRMPAFAEGDIQRLSSKDHWDVPVQLPRGLRLHLLASHPTPPVFDGPEDFNGRRNADEITFWTRYLEGAAVTDHLGRNAPLGDGHVVVLGDLNADPADGDGLRDVVAGLLAHPRLQDPQPASEGGRAAANEGHAGDPALDTADWNDTRGPGNLRVDFVLPDARLDVVDAGVFWPAPESAEADLLGEGRARASDHRLVWVDIALP